MSVHFFYEDKQDAVVDEHGRSEPMDYVVDGLTEDAKKDVDVHMRGAPVKRVYTHYTDQDKVKFFKLLFEKCLSASTTAQRCAKQYEEDPDSILRSI
ncbi:hypothetical protein VTP01DRAFT_5123 [Rhizomucor pusillus]|uniref:uncharacterized protein n=1 Tax=Rhizomucor pusillus TaxID=4840 RepID=UPI003743CC6D